MTQIGYIVCLRDRDGNRSPIVWKSKKAKRVAKSTIEAESLSLGESAEWGIYLRKLWSEIMGKENGGIVIKTDSRTLQKTLTSVSGVQSRRLRIDLAAIKEMIETKEIKELEWVGTKEKVADILTKKGIIDEPIIDYISGKKIEEINEKEVEEKRERGRERSKIDRFESIQSFYSTELEESKKHNRPRTLTSSKKLSRTGFREYKKKSKKT